MDSDTYGFDLSKLLELGTNAYNATVAKDAAKANANAAAAASNSAAAKSNNWVRIAIIGGAALVVAVIAYVIFRRK